MANSLMEPWLITIDRISCDEMHIPIVDKVDIIYS